MYLDHIYTLPLWYSKINLVCQNSNTLPTLVWTIYLITKIQYIIFMSFHKILVQKFIQSKPKALPLLPFENLTLNEQFIDLGTKASYVFYHMNELITMDW